MKLSYHLPHVAVWLARETPEIVILGTPVDEEQYPDAHNCDAMGCGSHHVLIRATVTSADKTLPVDARSCTSVSEWCPDE